MDAELTGQWWHCRSARWSVTVLAVAAMALVIALTLLHQHCQQELSKANSKIHALQQMAPPLATWNFAQEPLPPARFYQEEAGTVPMVRELFGDGGAAVGQVQCKASPVDASMQQCVVTVSTKKAAKVLQDRRDAMERKARAAEKRKREANSIGTFAQTTLAMPAPPAPKPAMRKQRQTNHGANFQKHVSFSGPSVPMPGGVQSGLTSENMRERPEAGTKEAEEARQASQGFSSGAAARPNPITTTAHKRVLNERSDAIKKVETRTYGSADTEFKWANDA